MAEALTQRQKEILDFISASIVERGFPPTLREIGEHFQIRSTNGVNDHLKALEKKGHVLEQRGWQIGHANCIEVDPQTGELKAVADIARDGGSAAAY